VAPTSIRPEAGLAVDHWGTHGAWLDAAVSEQAERFAQFRGLALTGIDHTG
jgi:hypothetical protein